MNKLIATILTIGSIFLFRRALISLATDLDDDAPPSGRPPKLNTALVGRLLSALGIEEIDSTTLLLLTVAAAFCSGVLGWGADIAFGERAFGPKLNGTIAFASGVFSVIGWTSLFGVDPSDLGGLTLIGTIGAALGVLACVLAKAALLRGVDDLMRGQSPAAASSKQRAAARIDAVTRRRR